MTEISYSTNIVNNVHKKWTYTPTNDNKVIFSRKLVIRMTELIQKSHYNLNYNYDSKRKTIHRNWQINGSMV